MCENQGSSRKNADGPERASDGSGIESRNERWRESGGLSGHGLRSVRLLREYGCDCYFGRRFRDWQRG